MITVSTVIPVRNREKFIVRALESVSSQTYPPKEVIIVDDASTDETPHIVENLAKKLSNLVLIRLTENVGAGMARNIGAKVANGDLLAFLDSDDTWYPKKLEKQINEFQIDKDIVAVLCGTLATTGDSSSWYVPPADLSLMALYCSDIWVGCSTAMISNKAFTKIGGFDASLPSCQDLDLFIRLAEIGKIRTVQEILSEYCTHTGDRISNNKTKVLLGVNIVFNKIYDKVSDPSVLRIIRGNHEGMLAECFCPDEPHRALGHALKAFGIAPSPQKLHALGRVAKRVAQSELRRLRKAFVR